MLVIQHATAQYITTIAGNGSIGTSGNNGPAICAGVPNPQGVCVDPTGNVYITTVNSIRRVDAATNIITTIAGSDTYGFAGDGGPANNALMMYPYDICMDPIGNIFVAEYSGARIRKISTDGTITTVAGSGVEGYSGDGGLATGAKLNKPKGIFVDGQKNLYIADTYNSVIRKIDAITGVITTIAGTGSTAHSGDGGLATNAGIPFPVSVAVDDGGNILILEVYSGVTSRLRRIDATTGIITTIAGSNVYGYSGDGGPAINANLFDPVAVEVDSRQNIYILQYDDSRLRKIDGATGIINTIAGNGTNGFSGDGGVSILASMNNPTGMGRGFNGSIYVADAANHRVRRISPDAPAFVTFSNVSVAVTPEEPCSGAPLTFTATVINGGSNAGYQWYVNSVASGTNTPTYNSTSLNDGDTVVCKYSSFHCSIMEEVLSNEIVVHFNGTVTPVVSISPDAIKVCRGKNITVTATVENATNITYQWHRNEVAVGNNSASYTYAPEALLDNIRCDITTSGCSGGLFSSEVITVGAYQVPEINITPSESTVPPGTTVQLTASINGNVSEYSWLSSEGLVNENTLSVTTAPVKSSHPVMFIAETYDGCIVKDTANIYVFVKMTMPNAFSPNGDGKNDIFRIPENVTFQLEEFSVFNRWGMKIFSTTDISKGWTGENADNGTYVYIISGVIEGRKTIFKGTVVLTR